MAVRILFLTGWVLLGVGGAVAHYYGPGVERRTLDRVAAHITKADAAVADGDYADAVDEYTEALKLLPAGKTAEARQLRLERAKAQMLAKQLPEAYKDLEALADELADDKDADPKLVAGVRSAQANTQYYATWLMRLEGEPRDVWEPEIENARQSYKLLAEQAEAAGDAAAATKHKEDLEAAVRLERMDLSELQGLNLPKQCCCNCEGNGCCNKIGKGKGKKKGKGKGKGPQPPDKADDARGAGGALPLDDSGH